jgi:hypothetical protein
MPDDDASMTPDELIARLVGLFPDFAARWESPDNLSRDRDGSVTLCGAFAEFSQFFLERYEELPPERLQALGWILAECMADPESELDEATATCFLENVAAERFHSDFERFLIGRPLEYYAQWGDGL